MKLFLISLFSLFLLYSCNTKKRELKEIFIAWENKEIIFPELNVKYMGKDTVIPNLFCHDFKILHYVDTVGCTACRLHLFDWKVFMKELDTLSSDVTLIFVVFSNNYKEFEEIQTNNRFTYPVLYDNKGLLNNRNKFPFHPYVLHTFLLDQDNKVLAIGDPTQNDAVRELYWKIIRGEIKTD